MNAHEITGWTHDTETYCTDHRPPSRWSLENGRRHGARAVYTGAGVDLGTHPDRAAAVEYARSIGDLDLDDDGEIWTDGICTAWIAEEEQGEPIYASTETDAPLNCADCGCLIETSLTREGRRYVVDRIAEHVTDGAGDPDVLQQWADSIDYSAQVDAARRIYAAAGGTWTHGTLRTVDLLDAAARCAETLAGLCPDDADDLRKLAAEARAIAAPDPDDEPKETYQEEDDRAMWTLEEICDAIDAALPAPLYYGCTEGDGSDIGIWPSIGDY